jgi:peptidoglycan hydrolase-like protein with peptidoglycan-binding domain
MGAYFGAVDGSMGEDFVMALKAFQTSRGLAATGELDASTQSALRETFTG